MTQEQVEKINYQRALVNDVQHNIYNLEEELQEQEDILKDEKDRLRILQNLCDHIYPNGTIETDNRICGD